MKPPIFTIDMCLEEADKLIDRVNDRLLVSLYRKNSPRIQAWFDSLDVPQFQPCYANWKNSLCTYANIIDYLIYVESSCKRSIGRYHLNSIPPLLQLHREVIYLICSLMSRFSRSGRTDDRRILSSIYSRVYYSVRSRYTSNWLGRYIDDFYRVNAVISPDKEIKQSRIRIDFHALNIESAREIKSKIKKQNDNS